MLLPIVTRSKIRTSSGLTIPLVLYSNIRSNYDAIPTILDRVNEQTILSLIKEFDPLIEGYATFTRDIT